MYGLPRDMIDTTFLLTYGLPEVAVSLFALISSALHEAAPAGSPRQIDFLRDHWAGAGTGADSRDFDSSLVPLLLGQLFYDMENLLKKTEHRATIVKVNGRRLRKPGMDKNSKVFVQVHRSCFFFRTRACLYDGALYICLDKTYGIYSTGPL